MKLAVGLPLICLLVASGLRSQQPVQRAFSRYVDSSGSIRLPQGYREWAHLGTYFVVGADNSRTLHSVYTEQSNIDAYTRSGAWPDGAVLVKEVMTTAADQLTTGAANWAADPVVWFVSVKDQQGRFSENRLWGDGWGWALFEAGRPERQAATNYKTDCLGCHLPARDTDLVFVQGYPRLHDRRPNVPNVMGALRMSPRPMAMAAVPAAGSKTGSTERGAAIFAQVCGICHSLEPGRVKVGPSLASIARDNKLPSGLNATRANIMRQIDTGGRGMPAFAAHLDAQQKADVIEFVRSRQ